MSLLLSDLVGGRVTSSSLFPDNPTYSSGSASGAGTVVNVGSVSTPVEGVFTIFVNTTSFDNVLTVVVDGKTITGDFGAIKDAFVFDNTTLNNVYTYPIIRFDTSLSVTIDTYTSGNLNWQLWES